MVTKSGTVQPTPKPKSAQGARPGPAGRAPKVQAPGRTRGRTPKPTVAAARPSAAHTRRRQVSGPRGKPAVKPPESLSELSADELTILKGLDSGPANIQVLSRRTGLPSQKISPILKNLSNSKMVISKRINKVQRFALGFRAKDLLHPPRFPATLFGGKGKGRRKGKRLTRRQKIRRYDRAIAAIIAVIVGLMLTFVYLYVQLDEKISEDKKITDDIDPNKDTLVPIIEWRDPITIFDEPFGTLVMEFLVIDNDNRTPISGVHMPTLKIQYAFASNIQLTKPDLSNWTWIVPDIDPPYATIGLDRSWGTQEGNYIFVRCSVEDNEGNFAVETFKILISF
jgi:hypothetical protein